MSCSKSDLWAAFEIALIALGIGGCHYLGALGQAKVIEAQTQAELAHYKATNTNIVESVSE